MVEFGENWVNVDKMSALIGRTKFTTLKLIQKGYIRAVLIGGSYRIYESEVVRFLTRGNHPDPIPVNARPRKHKHDEEETDA